MSSYTAIDRSCNGIDSPSVITSFVCCSRRINPYSVFNLDMLNFSDASQELLKNRQVAVMGIEVNES
jgi:hypothetical protein